VKQRFLNSRATRVAVTFLCLAYVQVVALACSHPATIAKRVEPITLARLALAPADLDNAYVVQQDRYFDDDGKPAETPTHEFSRQLRRQDAVPNGVPAVATGIVITLGDRGVDDATDFVDAAGDADVGPANLQDYIQTQIADSHDVHAELVPGFPSYDDQTVANRLTWQQTVDGGEQVMHSYGVYIRSGGLLALVGVRAPADASGGEPEGLRKQAESAVKRQADKLKQAPGLTGTKK